MQFSDKFNGDLQFFFKIKIYKLFENDKNKRYAFCSRPKNRYASNYF